MTGEELEEIRNNISYKNWSIEVVSLPILTPAREQYIYVSFYDTDGKLWTGRRWYLSPLVTKSEVVQTIFLAIKTAEEHEMREAFKYKGNAIFGPHFDVEALCHVKLEHR